MVNGMLEALKGLFFIWLLIILSPLIVVFIVFGLLMFASVAILIGNAKARREREAEERLWQAEQEERARQRRQEDIASLPQRGAYYYYDDDEEEEDDDYDESCGSGDDRTECPFCGGTGYAVDDIDMFDGDPGTAEELCDTCGGTGYL